MQAERAAGARREARREARVVVVGAGFAGAALLRSLPRHLRREGETLLVDRASELGFAPLIHEVATGRLHPKNIQPPAKPLALGRCDFLQADITGVNLEKKTLETTSGEVSYEYLVLATGSSASPPPEHLAPHFHLFWTLEDALSLRTALSEAWRNALRSPDGGSPDGSAPSVAVVGGGTTGVELASEIASLFEHLTQRTFRSRKMNPRVVLLEASDRLMGWLDPYFHRVSLPALEKLGVEVRLDAPVEEAGPRGVKAGEEWIPADIRIWTAGLRITGITTGLPGERDDSGRLHVTSHLTVPGHPEVYVLGDAGVHTDLRLGPLPPTASVAVQQGPFAARDIARRIQAPGKKRPEFDYFNRGYVVSLGPENAAAEAVGAKFSGPAAQALYRSVLLYYLKDRGGRALTAADWAMERIGRLGF